MFYIFRKNIYWILLFFSPTLFANSDFDPFKPHGRFINLGLQVMYIDCLGKKSPTVLIDVGLGDASANWLKIARALSNDVRVCLYDRAGYGWSDPGPGSRTTAQIVHELNMLLEFAEETGPYVIVGHSFGGFTARYFAATYPDKTVGAVLIDSSHPDQIYRLSPLDQIKQKRPLKLTRTEPAPDYMNETEKRWYFLNSSRKATFAQMEELRSFKESAYQVKHSGPLPDIPLAVLSRGKNQLPEINGVSLEKEWRDMQKSLLSLSKQSWQSIIKESGHRIYLDAPDEIIKNVLKVVSHAREKSDIDSTIN
ncbi:MAG: alpha/beta hydrolase [Proteobacteria bacterium]|nr:alpha/beta hydrolase [Pseudomonadota bacterium]